MVLAPAIFSLFSEVQGSSLGLRFWSEELLSCNIPFVENFFEFLFFFVMKMRLLQISGFWKNFLDVVSEMG